jgi:hypothetical protein
VRDRDALLFAGAGEGEGAFCSGFNAFVMAALLTPSFRANAALLSTSPESSCLTSTTFSYNDNSFCLSFA